MKYIEEYVLAIDDEICDAKEYAEKALQWKAMGNSTRYKAFYDMSTQEMEHARILHNMAVEEIQKLNDSGFRAPEEMQEIWNKSHKDYVEKVAWIKQMLTM